MEGRIKTFLPSKGYGYIQGNDSKSYLFYMNDMIQRGTAVEDGQFVAFEESATSEGYLATNVKILNGQTYYLQPAEHFFEGKKGAPKGMEVVYSEIIHTCDKDLDIAKIELRETAKRYGFNGIIGITYSRNTESSGNYQYSVHHFMGECVLLCRKTFTQDRTLAEHKNMEFKKTLHQVQSAFNANLDAESKRRFRKRLLTCIIAGALIAFIANTILQALLASPQ